MSAPGTTPGAPAGAGSNRAVVRPRAASDAGVSPPATRRATARWRDPRLALGLALVAACALVGARVLSSADDTVAVWAAGTALNPGQQVEQADLVRTSVRFRDQRDADRYLSADADLASGASVDRPVGEGELLARSALGGPSTGSLTEVPLSVGTEAVPDTVQVGSTVDVWVTPQSPASAATSGTASGGRSELRSTRVLRGVRVVSAPTPSTSLGPTATRQVIVGVGRDQSGLLPRAIGALSSGDVLLTARR